jgi:hypothetical protein
VTRSGAWLCLFALLCCAVHPARANPLEDLQSEGRLQVDADISPDGVLVPGQKLTLNLTIATDRWFTGGTRLGIPEVPGLVILQTEQFASNASENRGGKSWVIQRWSLDVYPQRPGDFTIPPVRLQLQVNNGEAGDVEGELYSPSTSFSTSLPAGLENAEHWVASPDFAVSQQFDRPLENLQVGDAFERDIRFEASEVMAMMLPPFTPDQPEGLAVYPSPPQLENNSNRGQTSAIRSQRVSYVIEQEGVYRLPPREFFWWDTGRSELLLLTLPAVEFTVGSGTATEDSSGVSVNKPLLLAVVGTLLVLALVAWLTWNYFPRSTPGWAVSCIATCRELWRQFRNPALPAELNPGSSAGERKASPSR